MYSFCVEEPKGFAYH